MGIETNLQERLINGVVRSITAAATGAGLTQVANSTWIGERSYDSFRQSLGVLVVYPEHDPLPQDLLAKWTREALLPAGWSENTLWLLTLALLLLLLLAHVVYRGSLGEESLSRLRHAYGRWHYAITLVILIGLASVLVAARRPLLLVGSFLLTAIPGSLYLILYCGDLRRGEFAPRFAWIAVALLVVASLLLLPMVHGKHIFDIRLLPLGADSYRFADREDLGFRVTSDSKGRRQVKLQRIEEGTEATEYSPFSLRSIAESYAQYPGFDTNEAAAPAVDAVLAPTGGES